MSAQHTPGPWTFEAGDHGKDGFEVYSQHLAMRARVTGANGDVAVRRANARLIAAAPELLHACEQAVEWLEGWASADPYIGVLRAAIAKATGSAS